MLGRPIRSDHLRIEERSIALHKAVVEKIRRDPRLLHIPSANLQRLEAAFSSQGARIMPPWLREWKEILENPDREEIFSFLISRDERACRLRQSSPFSGILTPRERWEIYETFATGTHHTGSGQYHRRA
jgi:hypothetical protein